MREQLECVVQAMRTYKHPWFVAGGWALELAAGQVHREHHDVDLCAFREHTDDLLAYFREWESYVAVPGEGRYEQLRAVEDTSAPRHELMFEKDGVRIEVLLIEREGEQVIFRRDPGITMAYERFARQDAAGRLFVAPEWQLLFKAKNPRPKDEADFQNHAPLLAPEARAWLRAALERHQPESAWIEGLE